MPLIEVTQNRYVSATIRLDAATATLIDQYATFVHASADDVVDKAVNEDRAVRQCCTHSASPQEWEWGSICTSR